MPSNRAVTFVGPHRIEIQDKGYPKLSDPKGRKIEHAAILKLVTTNICGSDLHIYHGRFAAPAGMVMGHENTGEVVEVGTHLLGASCIIVGDSNQERLDLVKKAGYEVVDTSSETPVPDQIASILGQRWVDSGIDCVGLECHGYGPHGHQNEEEAVVNMLMEVVKPAGAIGIPGVYTDQDPGAPTPLNKEGKMGWAFLKAWVKSPSFTAGQCPRLSGPAFTTLECGWWRLLGIANFNSRRAPIERH